MVGAAMRVSVSLACGRRAAPAARAPARPAAAFSQQRAAAPSRRSQRAARASRHVRCAAQADAGPGKLISKVEIPAFIPRSDLLDQLIRWAMIEIQEGGPANVGSACKVTPVYSNGLLWGFTVAFLVDGLPAAELKIAFDDESTTKYEWVGRGADGFPVLEGNSEEVAGKNFEVRKIDDRPVTEHLRSSIRDFCTLLVAAINKYYAFGSCFVDDAT